MEIAEVCPLEDEDAHAAANPVTTHGTVAVDTQKNETREDAQVRLLLEHKAFALIILGGAHDLSDNCDRLSKGKAEYIRVEL